MDYDKIPHATLNKTAKSYLKHLCSLEIMKPANGTLSYAPRTTHYKLPDGTIETFTELQFNFATLLSTKTHPLDEAYYMAGYEVFSQFISPTKRGIDVKNAILIRASTANSVKIQNLTNQIASRSVDKLSIDAAWLLNAQVNLFLKAEALGQLNTAARILNDISGHVSVDAKATNRIQVEDNVDYASILSKASKRLKPKLASLEGEVVG